MKTQRHTDRDGTSFPVQPGKASYGVLVQDILSESLKKFIFCTCLYLFSGLVFLVFKLIHYACSTDLLPWGSVLFLLFCSLWHS